MDLDTYHCSVNPTTGLFEFYSEGPKGKIKKVVNYQLLENDIYGMQTFNLCFGDWDELTKDIRDLRVSNNDDKNKVLATVASTIVSFTKGQDKCVVYAEGSTPARTRLYQMGINSNWEAINKLFFVQGRYKDDWEWFRNDRNYSAFSVMKK